MPSIFCLFFSAFFIVLILSLLYFDFHSKYIVFPPQSSLPLFSLSQKKNHRAHHHLTLPDKLFWMTTLASAKKEMLVDEAVVFFSIWASFSHNNVTATSSQIELKILCNSWEAAFAIKLNLQLREKWEIKKTVEKSTFCLLYKGKLKII